MTDGWQVPGSTPQDDPRPPTVPPTGPPHAAPHRPGPDLSKLPAPPPGAQPPPAPAGWGGAQAHGYGYGPAGPPPAPLAPLAPRPGVVPLRPLSLGEIYDGAFKAMRRSPGAMIGSAAIIGAVIAVVGALYQLLIGPSLAPFLDPATVDTVTEEDALTMAGTLGGGGLVTVVISLLGTAFLSGVLVLPVSRAVTGHRTTFGEVWRATWPRFGALLGLVALLFGVTLLGALLLVLPFVLGAAASWWFALLLVVIVPALVLLAIWATVVSTLAFPAVMLEKAGPVTALRRIWRLLGGLWTGPFWRSFGILLLAAIIVGFAQQIIVLPAGLLSGVLTFTNPDDPLTAMGLSPVQVLISTVATIVAAAVVYPFQAGVATLLYVDHRMRREGLDVDLARAAAQ